MNGPRRCLKSLPSRPSTPPVLPWKPPQNPMTSCRPVAALARRRPASTASAPPEKSWTRVSPSGVPDAPHRDARDEVDVLVAVLVPQGRAAAASHGQPRVEREGLVAGRDVARLARHDLARAGPGLARLAHRPPPGARGAPKRSARYAAITGAASSR